MRLLTLAAVPLVVLAACGGDPQEPGHAAAATATPAAAKAATTTSVRIEGFEFRPRTITVTKGTRVTWRNRDAANHTVTFEKRPGDLGNVDEGKRLSARFQHAGRYAYVCQYHPNMRGTIVVR
jgi:plastocyanin